jgi:hypothetical protein
MCDADRARYAGPEWVEISIADLLDEETGLIEAIEEEWGLTPSQFLNGIVNDSFKATRAMIWAARRKAGCVERAATFRPKILRNSGVVYEWLPAEQAIVDGTDADPPVPTRAQRRARPAKQTTPRTAASKP